jgi:RNA polymerase sigma factor (sigma-70 family)
MKTVRADVLDILRRAVGRDDATDAQLLERFLAERNEDAFRELVCRHGPMVRGVCRRLIGHLDDADDAFQAVFLVLARKGHVVRPRSAVGNWLHGVAYRTALEARTITRRRAVREKQVGDMPQPRTLRSETEPDLKALLDAELARLPERYRLPVVLCELEGRSRKDAARQLGVPEGTLSSRLAAARKMLASRLARRGLACAGAALALPAEAAVPAALITATTQVAVAANTAAPFVAALSERVVKTMLLAKLKLVSALLLTVCAATFGIVRQIPGPAVARPAEVPTAPIVAAAPEEPPAELPKRKEPEPEAKESSGWRARMLIRTWVSQIAFTADGRRLATGGPGEAELWDVTARKEHEPETFMFKMKELVTVQSVAFSPDGKLLAFGDDAGTVRIWDVVGKRELFSTSEHSATSTGLAFSRDGTLLAGVGKDGRLVVWHRLVGDVNVGVTWASIGRVEPAKDAPVTLTTVAYSPDGRLLVIGSANGTTTAYEVASLKIVWQTRFHNKRGVTSIAFSPDGKLVATCGTDERIELIDARTGKLAREIRGGSQVASVAFSEDGKTLAAAGTVEEGRGDSAVAVALWEPATGKELARLKTTLESAHMIAFSPDGKRLAVIGRERPGVANKWGGIIYVWEREK